MISFFTMVSPRNSRELGATGIVRGYQITEKLGPELARCNPEGDYMDDVCIYIKQLPKIITRKCYVDVVDNFYLLPWLKQHPEVGVIASTRIAQAHFSRTLQILRKNTILIPQHHCNYIGEYRGQRRRRPVKTVGIIGSNASCELNIEELKARLAEFDMDLIWAKKPRHRLSVVRFLRNVDIQLVFRQARIKKHGVCYTALKLENAGSFRIPTVAYPEPCFDNEFPNAYIKVYNMDMAVAAIKALKEDKDLYDEMALNAFEISQKYHIDKIIEHYKALEGENNG